MSLSFSLFGDVGTWYSTNRGNISGGVIVVPNNLPPFNGYSYVVDILGDIYAVSKSGTNLTFNATTAYYPTSGAVKLTLSSKLYFFQDNGDGTGSMSMSEDGLTFSLDAYTVDNIVNVICFFCDDTDTLFCIDSTGNVYADVSGNGTDFQANGQTLPVGVDPADFIYVGSDQYLGAIFFSYIISGGGFLPTVFSYSGGFSAVTSTDLPPINNADGYMYSFYMFDGVFYATNTEPTGNLPAETANTLYSSNDGETWTLETTDIFGDVRNYISILYFSSDGTLLPGFGYDSIGVQLTTLYTDQPTTPSTETIAPFVGGAGGGGLGAAVGFSGVSLTPSLFDLDALTAPDGFTVLFNGEIGISLDDF